MRIITIARLPYVRRLDLVGDCWIECPVCSRRWQVRPRGPLHVETKRMLQLHAQAHREAKECRGTN